MTRYPRLLSALALIPTLVSPALAGEARPKAPFHVLYSNDTTNITSCVSPYHAKRAGVTDDMIRATIDEALGADVQMLQPGMGAIPWWKSKVYPAADHYRYYEEKYKLKPNDFGRYMLDGGDLVQTFVDHCRAKQRAAFISLRLNDGHGLEYVGQAHPMAAHTVSRFYEDHYQQYRLGPDPKDWNQRVLNWAIPEVRAYKLALIRELCENYPLDGFELDFMRHFSYFKLDETTRDERCRIMTQFVTDVRAALDRTARPGQRRWLCVRVPALLAAHDALGIDLPAFVAAGVDMVNLSCSYFTVQQTDLPKIRALVPTARVYLEMTHTTMIGPSVRGTYDNFLFLRTTPEQFYTTAHLAYGEGADGVSLFNFVYYREHGGAGRGPFNEPPFEVLGHLGDRDWLARQPQWYLQFRGLPKQLQAEAPLPPTLKTGASFDMKWDLRPTASQTKDGLLRLMTRQTTAGRQWQVAVNGTRLEPAAFVAKPLPHPYEVDLVPADQYACFRCPRAVVKSGMNTITITLAKGPADGLQYVDLVLP